jgi:hypothetical protein
MSKEKFPGPSERFKKWIDEGKPENTKFNAHLAEVGRRLKRLSTDFSYLLELNMVSKAPSSPCLISGLSLRNSMK